MKQIFKSMSTLALAVALTGCTVGGPSTTGSSESGSNGSDTYTVGILQLVQHPALDQATEGFKDVLSEEFGENVEFDEQNAAGDTATANTIAASLVSEKCDLILANATASLQAVSSATSDIPVLGTAVTDYAAALSIKDYDASKPIGNNISGTSDGISYSAQVELFTELVPDAKNVGILYCSAEPNSVVQAEEMETQLTNAGFIVKKYTFADTNDISSVTQTACQDSDVIYIPTDNTAASCTEAINNVASPAGVPIIAAEENIASGCGIATLSISYYQLGRQTGEMAVKILKGEEKVSDMPVESQTELTKKYVKSRCDALGIKVPDTYEAIEE
ncbi:MAG: ABC transporter substrate-binding protein [Bulleidia sp.]|nr:ABC transporter substrate-binding protein [Bulleidia sp.]